MNLIVGLQTALLSTVLVASAIGIVGNRVDAGLGKACGMGWRFFIQQR